MQPLSNKKLQTKSRSHINSQKSQQTNFHSENAQTQIEISLQELIPIISCVKDENQQLNQEKILLQKDLQLLNGLSKSLLSQNIQLRKHYQQRTNDIAKISHTIALNLEQEQNDIKHISHIIKQHNSKIFKEIQKKAPTIKLISKQIQHYSETIKQIQLSNNQQSQNVAQIKVKAKQLQIKYENSLKNKYQLLSNNLDQLQFSQNKLLMENCDIKTKNKNLVKIIRNGITQNCSQKPQIENEAIGLIKNNQQLKKQLVLLTNDEKRFEDQNFQLQKQSKSLFERTLKLQKQYQKKRLNLLSITRGIQQLNERMIKQKKIGYEMSTKQQELIKKKESLAYQISTIKFKMEQKKNSHLNNKNQKKVKLEVQKSKISNKIQGLHLTCAEQLNSKINPEIIIYQSRKQDIEVQYDNLQKEVEELKTQIHRMDNTQKQVIRMQIELTRKKQK